MKQQNTHGQTLAGDLPDPVKVKDLARRYGVSHQCILVWVRSKRLPPPVQIGPKTRRWSRLTILEWERSRDVA
jgi:predicted DNA-binding transcriptional regulator AlpA